MSGKPQKPRVRSLGRAAVAVIGAVLAMQASACQDASRGVAPDLVASRATVSKSPAPPAGVSLGAPLFKLDAAPDGSLLAAVASVGVVAIGAGATEAVAALPGANGVAALGRGEAFVVTGGSTDPSMILPTSRKMFRVSNGRVRQVADLWAYEQAVNPDQIWNQSSVPVESNPFDVAVVNGGQALVADAAANAILRVETNGDIDWVAVLTPVDLPGTPLDPQPVPTSVAIGPDGAYYVGELTGFPAIPGLSRVWRIAAGSRHATCPSTSCTLVAAGFTSIMDLAFGVDGTLYVVEFDEAGWLGVESNGFMKTAAGGTVSACNVATGSCSVLAGGLSLPTAITVDRSGGLWIAEHESVLFAGARVRRLQ